MCLARLWLPLNTQQKQEHRTPALVHRPPLDNKRKGEKRLHSAWRDQRCMKPQLSSVSPASSWEVETVRVTPHPQTPLFFFSPKSFFSYICFLFRQQMREEKTGRRERKAEVGCGTSWHPLRMNQHRGAPCTPPPPGSPSLQFIRATLHSCSMWTQFDHTPVSWYL